MNLNMDVSARPTEDRSLVQQLIGILRDVGPDKLDHAVVEARDRFKEEAREAKRLALNQLLYDQRTTLDKCGTPEHIMDFFWTAKSQAVRDTALAIWESKYPNETLEQLADRGIYIVIPVVPQTFRGIHDLMITIQSGGGTGCVHLDTVGLYDVVRRVPLTPYYIYDVEDGSGVIGNSPEEADRIFGEQTRRGLTIAEAIALAAIAGTLLKHGVWATGSRYDTAVVIPYITRTFVHCAGDFRAVLGCDRAENAVKHYGAASCGIRDQSG